MNKTKRHELLRLVDQSYKMWTSQSLPTPFVMENQRLSWLDQKSPYGLLVQNTETEPLFIYANQQAQHIFGYSLTELLSIPASQSAPPEKQNNRNRLLQEVENKGIAENYQGTRIDKQGRRFDITGSIWKVIDKSGETLGLAAMIWLDQI